MKRVDGDYVEFSNGIKKNFDAIVFATGYKSTVRTWLKVHEMKPLSLLGINYQYY